MRPPLPPSLARTHSMRECLQVESNGPGVERVHACMRVTDCRFLTHWDVAPWFDVRYKGYG